MGGDSIFGSGHILLPDAIGAIRRVSGTVFCIHGGIQIAEIAPVSLI